jgi:signal transduction histidine kinase
MIEVADTGLGIADNEQGRLFERFFRTSSATAQAIPGVGLGLSISKAIVEGHGGTIAVASREGHGTTFTIELPVQGAPDAARPVRRGVTA